MANRQQCWGERSLGFVVAHGRICGWNISRHAAKTGRSCVEGNLQNTVGQTRQAHLSDGSEIHLAPLSEVSVQFARNLRSVTLVQGEAYFDVKHDTRRPFQVRVEDVVVRDVGTRFNGRTHSESPRARSTLDPRADERQAATGAGSEALFMDVSNLPLAAIERIDILPDSSSTYYGLGAAGGVVNFV